MIKTDVPLIFIMGTLTFLVFVIFLGLIVVEYRKRQVRHITEKLNMKHQYESEALLAQLEVQEQSFKYISEELHDNIAQTLSLAKLKLYKTGEKVTDEKLKAGLDMSTELVGNALNDLRNLSHILNGGLVSRLSLQESIEKELNYISDVKDIETDLILAGTQTDPGPEKKLMIFRIVQEALNNAVKHGKATRINITLECNQGIMKLIISDNGIGFDTTKIDQSKGLGLHNIHVRAKLLGNLHIESSQNNGTSLTLYIDNHEQ
jgi:signal transduction histidine kinase